MGDTGDRLSTAQALVFDRRGGGAVDQAGRLLDLLMDALRYRG
jgi:hypothetical protein